MTAINEKAHELGMRIRELRTRVGMSEHAVAREISVSPKYIAALEEGEYGLFAAKVYAQGMLKKMMGLVAPGDADVFLQAFREAWDFSCEKKIRSRQNGADNNRAAFFYLTPASAGIGSAAVLLLFFVFFAAGRITHFIAPPGITVDEPKNYALVHDVVLTVAGKTERESKLTVNGRELTLDDNGAFHESIGVQPGLNHLEFLSEDRFGKSNAVVRYVVSE